jgi:hypothetical protein
MKNDKYASEENHDWKDAIKVDDLVDVQKEDKVTSEGQTATLSA